MRVSQSETKPRLVLLDTDTFSILGASQARDVPPALLSRIALVEPENIFLCGITAEETLRGALALIKAEDVCGKPRTGYHLLHILIQALARYRFLPYDAAAEQIYRSYPASVRRIGSADCKIAAVAQAQGAKIITRNARHFSAIPGVMWEDWTV